MSRVYFHSPSGEAELWGGERAWLGGLCSDIAVGILDPASNYDRLRSLVKPGHYVNQGGIGPEQWQWASSLALAVRVGFDGAVFAWNGQDIEVPDRAAYVASMHPRVALAVAGWLESEAGIFDSLPLDMMDAEAEPAIVVARAYLGTTEGSRP